MDSTKLLKDKVVLIVDDEVDVTDTVEEVLDMCFIRKANDYDSARQYLLSYTFDIVVLDIMGVNGFDLLKLSVKRGFPTVMLTAYAMTPEDVKKSYQEGAASFVPKEKMADIEIFLTDIFEAREKGKSLWWRWFDRLADYCERKFGPDWQKEHGFRVR